MNYSVLSTGRRNSPGLPHFLEKSAIFTMRFSAFFVQNLPFCAI